MTTPNPFETPPAAPANPWTSVGQLEGTVGIVVPPNTAKDRETGEIIFEELPDGTRKPYDKDKLLLDWRDAHAALQTAKAYEMDLRTKIVATYSDPVKLSGTENIPIGMGWIVKVAKKLEYKFTSRDENVSTESAVRAMTLKLCTATRDSEGNELNPELGKLIASRLKWAPSMALDEYKALLPGHKEIVDTVMEIKSGSPTVTLVDPEEAKGKRK